MLLGEGGETAWRPVMQDTFFISIILYALNMGNFANLESAIPLGSFEGKPHPLPVTKAVKA